jgi:hypothetical protein
MLQAPGGHLSPQQKRSVVVGLGFAVKREERLDSWDDRREAAALAALMATWSAMQSAVKDRRVRRCWDSILTVMGKLSLEMIRSSDSVRLSRREHRSKIYYKMYPFSCFGQYIISRQSALDSPNYKFDVLMRSSKTVVRVKWSESKSLEA